jgi:hypothetical protein
VNSSNFSDEYILNKIVEHSKPKQKCENNGRVFLFPTLQLNTIKYREDEEVFLDLLKFFTLPASNLHHLTLATGYLNL